MPKDRDSPFIPNAGSGPLPDKRPNPKLDRLNKLFSGGKVEAPRPGPVFGGAAMGSKMRIERLRGAQSEADLVAAVDSLLANHQMPDEPELLCKMLRHPDAGVGERVVAELGSLRQRRTIQFSVSMKDELAAFAPRCKEPNARRLLDEMLAA